MSRKRKWMRSWITKMPNMQIDNIYCMDCLEGMKNIPDGSIDAIICDLPYEVLHKNNPKAQWDRLIPFIPLWEQYLRIAKWNAPIILFCQGMFTAQLMMSQPDLWKYNLIWEKGRATGFLNANRMPMRNHEDIAVFYRSQPTYNPQKRKGDSHPRGNGMHKQTNQCYGEHKEAKNKVGATYDYNHVKVVDPTGSCFPMSVLHFAREHNSEAWHPTQKPVDLLRYLVRTYSNEGDTILDNCMGSGTTAIACIKEKRHFIGFEMNRDYYERSLRRIDAERRQLTIF